MELPDNVQHMEFDIGPDGEPVLRRAYDHATGGPPEWLIIATNGASDCGKEAWGHMQSLARSIGWSVEFVEGIGPPRNQFADPLGVYSEIRITRLESG